MSEYYTQAVVVEKVIPHPNADRLDICTVLGGYPCITTRGDFREGDLAAYLSVDALVDGDRPEFAFLGAGKKHRIKARKLRGTFSMGLLLKAPPGFKEGDDVSAHFGVEKWLPPAEREIVRPQVAMTRKPKALETRGYERTLWRSLMWASFLFLIPCAVWPSLFVPWLLSLPTSAWIIWWRIREHRKVQVKPNLPYYDIEGLRRFKRVFEEGEEVSISEKVHGANASFVHDGKRLHSKSRSLFRTDETDFWNTIAKQYNFADKLKPFPNVAVFGEIVGATQAGDGGFNYGLAPGKVAFVAFDVFDLKTRTWYDVDAFHDFCKAIDMPVVPHLYRGPWKPDLIALADGPTTFSLAKHCREGIVIRPVKEQIVHGLGRKVLKYVSESFHLRKDAA